METGIKTRTAAVVLAAGSGKRMGSSTKKQYILLDGKPIIYYALKTFQGSFVDEIVLVASPGEISLRGRGPSGHERVRLCIYP